MKTAKLCPTMAPSDDRGQTPVLRAALVSPEEALADLVTVRYGLTDAEAVERLEQVGPNRFPRPRGPTLGRRLVEQLVHFFALMLWIAAGLAFVGGLPEIGVAIIVVILVNGAFSFVQEYRTERTVRSLSALLPERAVVRREGRKLNIPAAELVPGDIVLLSEGERISADARVVRSSELKVDMSTLTGESMPVARVPEVLIEEPADLLEAPNLVFAGTFVTSGSGLVVVAATGPATRLGTISRLTGEVVRRPTPLRLQMNRAVRLIAVLAVTFGAVFFV